jgi:hypothetical protein
MTDKFEEFLDRLERPLPEPKTVRVADQTGNIQEAYMGLANAIMHYTVQMAQHSTDSILRKI